MGVVFKPTKVSVIIAVLNSHQIVMRYVRHIKRMRLPDDVEIIFMDDGSNPALQDVIPRGAAPNFYIYPTGDYRPWTQGLARNLGAKIAQGEYLFFTDIDHIITKEAIMAVREFTGDKMVFARSFGIFDMKGRVHIDPESLLKFGLSKERFRRHGLGGGFHTNTFAMKKELFIRLDGFNPVYCESGFHVGGRFMSEERNFYLKYTRAVKYKQCEPEVAGPMIYVYPIGRFCEGGNENPHDLFHSTSREQVPQPMLPRPSGDVPDKIADI